ncbi:hypothetical protein GCM10027074_01380 [Streptomyces deserti]
MRAVLAAAAKAGTGGGATRMGPSASAHGGADAVRRRSSRMPMSGILAGAGGGGFFAGAGWVKWFSGVSGGGVSGRFSDWWVPVAGGAQGLVGAGDRPGR